MKKDSENGDRTNGAVRPIDGAIQSNILKVVEVENTQKDNRTTGEKIAEAVAQFCGSMTFVYVHIVWFGSWIVLNSVYPRHQFDPFPYTFLTLVVSLEAIFLSTFILISQNHETKVTERRNHLDLQINMLAEQENTKMLELLKEVAEKVGVQTHDKAVDPLLEPVEPETMVEQIMTATAEDHEHHKHESELPA